MRVFSVTQVESFVEREAQGLRETIRLRLQLEGLGADALERRRDRGIVGRCGGESFLREPPFRFARERSGRGKLVGDRVVVRGRSHDSDIVKILGGGADHRRSADVDVLDQFLESDSGLGRGLLEGIEVDHHHIDGSDAVFGNRRDVLGIFAAMQDAAVNLGMQRLDAAIEHLGESGEIGDVFDGDAGIAQEFRGASGGDEFDAKRGKLAGEIDESGFVGDAENGAAEFGLLADMIGLGTGINAGVTEDSIEEWRGAVAALTGRCSTGERPRKIRGLPMAFPG